MKQNDTTPLHPEKYQYSLSQMNSFLIPPFVNSFSDLYTDWTSQTILNLSSFCKVFLKTKWNKTKQKFLTSGDNLFLFLLIRIVSYFLSILITLDPILLIFHYFFPSFPQLFW